MVLPRFEIGQKAFVYRRGKLKEVIISFIIITISKTGGWVEYQFEQDDLIRSMFSDYGTIESEVFASKEEFVNIV